MTAAEIKHEFLKCRVKPAYFIHNYCQIYDAEKRAWIPFRLWVAQFETLKTLHASKLVILLKARQLGMTWLVLAFALWLMLFHPAATVLLFSKRDDEATDLLDFRLKGMYRRLPTWMQCRDVLINNNHQWELSNGSRALSFPTTGGRSYTANLVIVDEADFVPDLNEVLNAVQPTIDAGGQLFLLSTPNKATPQSMFKQIYKEAKEGAIGWVSVFLAWWVAPWRTVEWYARKTAEILRTTTSKDDLYKEYPATDTEALAPASLDKRIAAEWLEQCKDESIKPIPADALPEGAPSIPGLVIYRLPDAMSEYVIGADPAEGNPTSDESAATLLDRDSGEEIASLAGKFQPSTFASHIDALGMFYNKADVMVERNNHGHAVLLWLRDNSKLRRLKGHDGKFGSSEGMNDKVPKEGWLSNPRGKSILYDTAADAFRESDTVIHSFVTLTQLSLIEGSTLRAPEGELDDRADSYALALVARDDRFNPGERLARDARKLREKLEKEKAERG